MSKVRLGYLTALMIFSVAISAPVPKEPERPTGIFILDDCDAVYRGKERYTDNLTLIRSTGQQAFRVTGFNNCVSIGSNRAIAPDPARQCVWVVENVAHRLRRFDLDGRETLAIPGVHACALAVDPRNGNVWALVDQGGIGRGRTIVYDTAGKEIESYGISGWDIVYDPAGKAFLIAEQKLTRINVAGEIAWSVDVSTWCATSLDVDPRNGAAWVAVGLHDQVAGSSNRLLKIDSAGKEVVAIDMKEKSPCRVSVDPRDGSVWAARARKSVLRYSAEGKLLAEHAVEALSVQVDPAGGAAWVATPTELLKMSSDGQVSTRVRHAGKTGQAWLAALR